jgi:hypothetical protein
MLTPAQKIIAKNMGEKELQNNVIDLAKQCGWMVMHTRPAKLANGEYRTALQGNKGAPDIFMARHGRLIITELKSEKGELTGEQINWRYELYGEPGKFNWKVHPEYYIWRPSDWLDGTIENLLKEGK